jgi:hypothetical protein
MPKTTLQVQRGRRRGPRRRPRAEERRELHPDAPWLWNEAWAEGRLRGSARATVLVLWLFAAAWNAIALPLAFSAPREVSRGSGAALLALALAAVGIALLWAALRATRRWRRYGAPVFEMADVPAPPGGELRGTLHVGEAVVPKEAFEVRLSCLRRSAHRVGGRRRTDEELLWSDCQRIPAGDAVVGPQGRMIAVRFAIPPDAKPSDPLPGRHTIAWRLEATADVPGAEFHARFDVPVFAARPSRSEHTGAGGPPEPVPAAPAFPGAEGDRMSSGIAVRPHPGGGTEIRFPTARSSESVASATVVALLLAGATTLLYAGGASAPVTATLGAATAIALCAGLAPWLGSTRLIARREEVLVQRRLLGLRRTRRVAAEQIADVGLELAMRGGDDALWDLRLHLEGKPNEHARRRRPGLLAGSRIRYRHEAERLAAIVRSALGR